jgi:4-amino-4-deoxy-L-arabinose transferase-like glycosyltransferase
MLVQAPTADRMTGTADRRPWPFGLAGVISAGLLYGLVYSAIRLSISHNLPVDDIKSNVYTQTLELGYIAKQPPLYEWLLWLVQRITGPTLPSFLLLKYSLLTATFGFLYLVAKRIFADQRWATLATLSPLMLYQVGWNLHEGVTQTVMLMCMVAASTWCFMRIAERATIGSYLLFGLAAGLGLISKYNYAGFLVVLLASALLQPALRVRVLDWRMLASLAMGAAVTAPVVYWLIAGNHDLVALYQSSIAPMAATNWFEATGIGLVKAVYAPLAFLFPLDVIVLLFPGVAAQGWAAIKAAVRVRSFDRSEPDWWLLLVHITLGGFVVLIIGAVATGATHYLERYMHPFFLLTPLWLLGLVEQSANASRRLIILGALLVATTVLVVPLRIRDLLPAMGPECHKCRVAIPYKGLAAALASRGFESGTLIAATREDAGNLRRMFPDARIVRLERPPYAPPLRAADLSSKVAVVWRKGPVDSLPKGADAQFTRIAGSVTPSPEQVVVPWQPYPATSAQRRFEWIVVVAAPKARD